MTDSNIIPIDNRRWRKEFYGTYHHYDRHRNMWLPRNHPVPRFMAEFGFQSAPSVSGLRR